MASALPLDHRGFRLLSGRGGLGGSGLVVCGLEHEEFDLDVGADVLVGDEREHVAAAETLDGFDELVLHGVLEGAARLLDGGPACTSIIVFSTSV
jgi:hypothetical protein